MNSVANGKVRRMTPFRRVYVQAAAGDAGGAIGSAFAVWHKLGGKRTFVMDHAYWGPTFDAAEIAGLLSAQSHFVRSRLRCSRKLCRSGSRKMMPSRS
jgi:carbamoyltransferase